MDFTSSFVVVKEAITLSASIVTIYQALSSFGRPELSRDKKWLSNCKEFKQFVKDHPNEGIEIINTEKTTTYRYTGGNR